MIFSMVSSGQLGQPDDHKHAWLAEQKADEKQDKSTNLHGEARGGRTGVPTVEQSENGNRNLLSRSGTGSQKLSACAMARAV